MGKQIVISLVNMFIPTTKEESSALGWQNLDIILISGDTYIDSPFIGISIIGKVLIDAGYRVGIIAQPDLESPDDITRLGEPELFWGVSAGSVDSMVSNYTPLKKRRNKDDLTPGGINNKRPDRASIVYTNLIKRYFKNTKPIILGGIEASLRRTAHYDYWDNKIRRSILFDAKADVIVYGMGEKTILQLADRYSRDQAIEDIKGICYISKEIKDGYIELPSYELVKNNKDQFKKMFDIFYQNNDPINSRGLYQLYDNRYLIHNPPQISLSTDEIDKIYDLDYERDVHPFYSKLGKVKAVEIIKNSITSHRGCYGECNFCAISVHQGRRVVSRSVGSIVNEAKKIASAKDFKGYILDVGGPTANMYEIECEKKIKSGSCKDKRCIYPDICKELKIDHNDQIKLLEELRKIENIKKVFIASGIRYDMVIYDKKNGDKYLKEIVNHHVSGQLKIAPEHTSLKILELMGKPGDDVLKEFKDKFNLFNKKSGKKQFLTYYFIAAHPGCEENDMKELRNYIEKELKLIPEQVQIFTPTPSTYSSLMFYLEEDPFSGKRIFTEKDNTKKQKQKEIILRKKN